MNNDNSINAVDYIKEGLPYYQIYVYIIVLASVIGNV